MTVVSYQGAPSFRRRLFLASTAFVAFVATPVMAQEAEADGEEPTEILVTAQKRNERLLDVPVSVSVVQGETLLKQNLVQLRDYYSRVPGLSISGGGNEQRASALALRGISANTGTASTVAITLDDVPLNSATYRALSPLPDFDPAALQGIEVLRGPQGTLYGASSLGGLIKYVTRTPDATKFSGRIEGGVNFVEKGDIGYSGRGTINVPIIEDRVAIQASGFYRRDAGYIDNTNPAINKRNINANRADGGRAALFLKPIDPLTINLSVLHQRNRNYGSPVIRVCASCGTGAFTTPVTFDPVQGDMTNRLAKNYREIEFTVYQARANLDLGFAEVTSISAWSRVKSMSDADSTNTFSFLPRVFGAPAGATVPFVTSDNTKRFSQEVRIASKNNETLEWIIGGFYTKEHTRTDQDLGVAAADGSLIGKALLSVTTPSYEEKAVFADATVHLTPQFDVQGGIRYGRNTQTAGGFNLIYARAAPIFVPGSPPGDVLQTPAVTKFSDNTTTWLAGARYRFSPDTMLYARVATGYRPGSTNTVLPGIPETFGADMVTSYELGLKGQIRSASLTYELAAFQIDWDDIQLQATNVTNQIGFFYNGSTARSRGVEAALTWTPSRGLRIDANASYTDAKLTGDVTQPAGAGAVPGKKGDRLVGSPKFAGNLSVQNDWQLPGDVTGTLGGNLSFVGDRAGLAVTPGAGFAGKLTLPAYALVDVNAGLSKDGWSATFYVRNLFNERAVLEATTRSGTSSPTAIFAQPRTYGVTVARSF